MNLMLLFIFILIKKQMVRFMTIQKTSFQQMPVDIFYQINDYLPYQEKWRLICSVKNLGANITRIEQSKIDKRWSELFAKYSVWHLEQNPFAIHPSVGIDSSPAINPLPEILANCTWYKMPHVKRAIESHFSRICRTIVTINNSKQIKEAITLAKKIPLPPLSTMSRRQSQTIEIGKWLLQEMNNLQAIDRRLPITCFETGPSPEFYDDTGESYFPMETLSASIADEAFRLWTLGDKEKAIEKAHLADEYSGLGSDMILRLVAYKFLEQSNTEAANSVADLIISDRVKKSVLRKINARV